MWSLDPKEKARVRLNDRFRPIISLQMHDKSLSHSLLAAMVLFEVKLGSSAACDDQANILLLKNH